MNSDSQRIAIAEASGWIECRPATCVLNQFTGIPPKGLFRDQLRAWLPNYLTDLNAMREVEMWLFNNKGVHFSKGYYETHLPNAVGGMDGCWMCISATAAQRAEAFLKTLDKWENAIPQNNQP